MRVLRMIRAMRVFRIFKAVRYSKSFKIIGNVLRNSKDSLVAVCVLVFGIAIVALPAGIITAGYMKELDKQSGKEDDENEIDKSDLS